MTDKVAVMCEQSYVSDETRMSVYSDEEQLLTTFKGLRTSAIATWEEDTGLEFDRLADALKERGLLIDDENNFIIIPHTAIFIERCFLNVRNEPMPEASRTTR